MGCHLPYGITLPDTNEHASPNSSQTSWYSINLPKWDGRQSWPRWLGTYRDGLPVSRQSPIQVVTVPSVEQLHWSRPTCYHYTTQPLNVLWVPVCQNAEHVSGRTVDSAMLLKIITPMIAFSGITMGGKWTHCHQTPAQRGVPSSRARLWNSIIVLVFFKLICELSKLREDVVEDNYPDDSIQLLHRHLLRSLNSCRNLLLMLHIQTSINTQTDRYKQRDGERYKKK